MSFFSSYFGITIKRYHCIDLENILDLQKLYLQNFNFNFEVQFHDAKNFGSDIEQQGLFLISNYCIGEISKEYCDKYIDVLFKNVSHGFITWNTLTINKRIEKMSNKIEEENPLTYWHNKYIQ